MAVTIAVVGVGYVGLVSGACFADSGNDVVCVDLDRERVAMLSQGRVPIYEPGLEELVRRNLREGRLRFTTDLQVAVAGAHVSFVAVGTPPGPDGAPDLDAVFDAARAIAAAAPKDHILVLKSTVAVGTNDRVQALLDEIAPGRIEVCSCPEFLKEGSAIEDFTRPDRVVVGSRSARAAAVLRELYAPFLRREQPFLAMAPRAAELAKYAANAMLALRISFINELAALCEAVNADINEVRRGLSSDRRIGAAFLFPGIGYGGSCFPKDVDGLIHAAGAQNLDFAMLRAAQEVNQRQKRLLFDRVKQHFGADLGGRRFAVWGLAFKPRTDDMREAPSLVVLERLLEAGAGVSVYDPEAMANARRIFGHRISYCVSNYEALEGADALLVLTEWNEFRHPDFERMKKALKTPIIFDGRNLYDPALLKALGFSYYSVGRRSP